MVCAPAASPTACRWAANSNTWTAGRCPMRSGREARCLEGQGNEGNERNEGNGRAMTAVATAQGLEVSPLPPHTSGAQHLAFPSFPHNSEHPRGGQEHVSSCTSSMD